MKKYKLNDFVFVNPDRGITPGIARVIRIFDSEAEIVFDNGNKDTFYFVHLYQTKECFSRKSEFLRERANKIGTVKHSSRK